MAKIILFILLLVSGTVKSKAQSAADDDIKQLQEQMYQLYNKNDEAAFIDITNQLKEAAQKAGDERTFYKAWSNQALYFANHQQSSMLNFIPRLRLTLQSSVTSKVLVNVTIGMGDFIHSSNAMARFVTNDMIKRVYIVPRFEKRFNLSISE